MKSSSEWLAQFQKNAREVSPLVWEDGDAMTDGERDAIASSVAAFQLGESGEGRHLLTCAEAYAAKSGDAAYVEALRLFVREEQRHAADLAVVMEAVGIPLIRKTWVDTVFRRLRHVGGRFGGLEVSVGVLVTAEIIAQTYYRALRDATSSRTLRRLCRQILTDEAAHVRFQTERLAILRQGRGRVGRWVTAAAHRGLFGATCLIVWWKHGRAMREGGFSFGRFWRGAWSAFRRAMRTAEGRVSGEEVVGLTATPQQRATLSETKSEAYSQTKDSPQMTSYPGQFPTQ
ncbi:MAG: ferritin-like domain-containing protein [Candidatus Poribacteria bacterium]|nr:ferritin-like domain-containing protein [Candidatus Poribacteria bacterium]